jgi:hypothetical protein
VLNVRRSSLALGIVWLIQIILVIDFANSAQKCALSDEALSSTKVFFSSSPSAPDVPDSDPDCCSSCLCCHGYALPRFLFLDEASEDVGVIQLQTSLQALRGIALPIENPPRSNRPA